MTLPSEFDSSNSAAAGIYRQNGFYVRMGSLFDLEPEDCDPVPSAVAMHAHEYTHFLHNASTTAGQAYLHSNLILLRAMASGCDDQGYFLGLQKMSEQEKELLCFAITLMNIQLGTTSAKQMNGCNKISQWEFGLPKISETENGPIATSNFSAQYKNGIPKSQSIDIGLGFITEGVAYEIDREMRRLNGTSDENLDLHTPIFPYLAYREAIKIWSSRILQSREIIAIGITALSHIYPGFWLTTICEKLRNSSESVDAVLEKARNTCLKGSERIIAMLRLQRNDLSKGDVLWTAIGQYMELAEAGVRLRQKNWAPEFDFISNALKPNDFKKLIGSMIDCLFIQEKSSQEVDLYWIGPGIIAGNEKTASCLGALQSALHFSQLHLKTDGTAVATSALKEKSISCPFSGGCQQERNDQYPDACKASPWTRFTPSSPGELVCWYAAGVKGLRNPANVYKNTQCS
ncbi:hypothetical protein ACTVKO_01830 [Serratia nevei]|uniref:hypothetical protein n=1 Tax=Serratia nevei TaxID=2703794 RepID=UPI003FA71567